eukprot:9357909-Prorocentrum_lima.AAC.1
MPTHATLDMHGNVLPWPAWDDVDDSDDGGRAAWLRSWAPHPVVPSGNLAGWHTYLIPRKARNAPGLECPGEEAAWIPGPPTYYRRH